MHTLTTTNIFCWKKANYIEKFIW